MKHLRLYILFILGFSAIEIQAQIVTDRPDQTEASSTVPGGALQIESGFLVEYSGESEVSRKTLSSPNTLFRYGITDGFELRLFNQYESNSFLGNSFSGISDLEIGFKAQIKKQEEGNTEVAFMSHLIVPSGTAEFTIDNYGFLGRFLITHTLSENSSLGYNIGYEYFGTGDGNAVYTLSYARSINDTFGFFLEPYGALVEMDSFAINFNAGLTCLLTDNIQLDFSFGTGITERMNFLSFGISGLIEKAKK